MPKKKKQQYPVFKGLRWHRNQFFSFFIPIDWHTFAWQDGREGVIYGPAPDDPHTVFAAELHDLGLATTPDDLDDLRTGFVSAIEQLPGCHIETQEHKSVGNIIILEARYTYMDSGQQRKRWSRVLYHETRQITFTAQGASVDAFHYWMPMFFEAMMTLRVHNTMPTPDSIAP